MIADKIKRCCGYCDHYSSNEDGYHNGKIDPDAAGVCTEGGSFIEIRDPDVVVTCGTFRLDPTLADMQFNESGELI